MADEPLTPRNPPYSTDGKKFVFGFFSVDDAYGNPAQVIKYQEELLDLAGWNSNLMEVTYQRRKTESVTK
jgi:hypothetical protein